MAHRFAALLVNRFDLAFTLGRIFGLLPVLIMSRQIVDTAVLAERVSDYQIAMFLATLVLYGAPQIYLVKRGIERRVFVHHMAMSAVLFVVVLWLFQAAGFGGGLILPFVFLVIFRSYYLLYASYFKSAPYPSFVLITIALVTLALFGLTMNYLICTAVGFSLTMALVIWHGDARWRYTRVAARNYFTLLRRNSGYFVTFLLQQTFTQITLAVFALVAVGEEYLLATHLVYVYSISFIFHGVLFRYYLFKMSRERAAGTIRATMRKSLQLSLILGAGAALCVVLFYDLIETILFSRSYLTPFTSAALGVMILLNSANSAWSALFLSYKRPFQLASITAISTGVVVGGIVLTSMLGIINGLIYAMLLGLLVQAILRSALGIRLLWKVAPKA